MNNNTDTTNPEELAETLENLAYIINNTKGKANLIMLDGDILQQAANLIRQHTQTTTPPHTPTTHTKWLNLMAAYGNPHH